MKCNELWKTIDKLALRLKTTPSGLAKLAGLDATSFNKSKRFRPDGNPRWPSMESVNKVLQACNITFEDFIALSKAEGISYKPETIALIDIEKLGDKKHIDDNGALIRKNCNAIKFPNIQDNKIFAIDITTNKFEPWFKSGNMLIISPNADIRRGDRLVLKTVDNEIIIGELIKKTVQKTEIKEICSGKNMELKNNDILWSYRIIWTSQ